MKRLVPLLLLLLSASLASAQDPGVAPLIREEKPIRVRTGDSATQPEAEKDPAAPAPTPAPDPRFVLVAIVNNHSLTRAQLDLLTEVRLGDVEELAKGGSSSPAVMIQLGPDGKALSQRELLDNQLVAAQQQDEIDDARRQLEGELVQEWVEFNLLADEARRQGLLIDDVEYESRLAEIRAKYLDGRVGAERILADFGMTGEELEARIYDALLIEKLMDRFIALNITEEEMRQSYEQNRQLYITPELYRAPHFSIALIGDETKDEAEAFRRLADKVRKELASGAEPEKVFEEANANRLEYGIYGDDLGWFDVTREGLPPVVRAELVKMKVGDVSPVLTQWVKMGREVKPSSYHVVKLAEKRPPTGLDFESARPKVEEAAQEVARSVVLGLIRQAKTHKVITNLRGIPPAKIPPEEERMRSNPAIALRTGG